MIQINGLSKSFGAKNLFNGVTFSLDAGERVGLVGRNGSGKSTLFKIILGQERADSGEIVAPGGYKIEGLSQHIAFTKKTLLEECTQVLRGDEQFDFYKAERILMGLGFSEDDFQRNPESFSGGYQVRINLCKSLLNKPNLLLLDEPTNYLDVVSVRWLKIFLRSFPGEMMLVTHDRDFMDGVTTHTAGILRGTCKKIRGGTEKYYAKIKEEEDIYEKTRVNQEKKKKDMMENIRRFRSKARRASQAQSKLKQVEKMEIMDKLSEEGTFDFSFRYKECPAKTLGEIEDLSFGYDEPLFSGLNFFIRKNDRIGIVGKNGKGKSTLLNALTGELKHTSGFVKYHPEVRFGHFGQMNIDRLYGHNTVVQEIQESNDGLSFTEVGKIAGSMMFSGDDGKKKIEVLSGGERARVMLGKVLARPCNLLLLDEPTNHLDIESVESLKEEIKNFPGACLLVTHNELLLRELCNRLIIFHQGGAEFFLGNYDDFLEKIGWDEEEGAIKVSKKKVSRKDQKKKRSSIIKERSLRCTPLKAKIQQYEEEIIRLEKALEEKIPKLTSEDTLGTIAKEIGQIHKKIEASFSALEESTEKYEALKKRFDEELDKV